MKNHPKLITFYLRISLSVYCILWCAPNFANSQTTQVFEDWVTFGGTQNLFIKAHTATDAYASVYVAGATRNANGDYDIFITKHDKHGNLIWTDQYDGVGNRDDVALALYVDAHCKLFVTGTTFTSSADTQDVVVITYDSSGTQNWVEVYSGGDNLNDYGTAITVDSDTIYVGGVVTDSTDSTDFLLLKFDLSGSLILSQIYDDNGRADLCTSISKGGNYAILSGATQTGAYDWDYLIVKINSISGSVVAHWTTGGTTNGFDQVNGACLDNSGNVCLTGTTFNGTSGLDIYTVVLDANLAIVWDEIYTSTGSHVDVGNGIVSDGSGNVYVTGSTDTTGSSSNFITIKYNHSGTQQWVKIWNSVADSSDSAKAIVLDNNGYPVVTGTSWSGSSYDYYTIKYDDSGNLLWEKGWNDKYNLADKPSDITKDDEGNIIVTGQSELPDHSWNYATVKYIERMITEVADTDSVGGVIRFVENRDQLKAISGSAVDRVLYYSTTGYPNMYFMNDTLAYQLSDFDNDTTTLDTFYKVKMVFVGNDSKLLPLDKDKMVHNYFLAHTPGGRPNVPLFKGFFKNSVWPAIDINFTSNSKGLKMNFIVSPKGNPSDIEMDYFGADTITIDTNYGLVIHTRLGNFVHTQPRAWELDDDGSFIALGWQPKYVVTGGNTVTFTDIGSYDSRHRLVISEGGGLPSAPTTPPTDNVQWSTFVGGTHDDWNLDITRNTNEDIFVCGKTNSQDFVQTTGLSSPPLAQYGGLQDGFISKFDKYGVGKWATFIGGSQDDAIQGLVFNESASTNDNLFFVGYVGSNDFPASPNPGGTIYYKNSSAGQKDALIGRLRPFDGFLSYGMYIGGENDDEARSVTCDGAGNIYFTGITKSQNAHLMTGCTGTSGAYSSYFPLCNNPGNSPYYQNFNAGGKDIFIVKFDVNNQMKWSSLYGSDVDDEVFEINLASAGPIHTLVNPQSTILICGKTYKTSNTNSTYNGSVPTNGDFPLCDLTGSMDYFEIGRPATGNSTVAFISQFTLEGAPIWGSNFNNIKEFQTVTSSYDNFYAVGLLDENVSITGTSACTPQTGSNIPICSSGGGFSQSSGGELYFVKLGMSSKQLGWSSLYGTNSWIDIFNSSYLGVSSIITWSIPVKKYLDAVANSNNDLYIMGTTLSGFDHYRHASIPTWYYQTTNYCGTSGENPPDAFVLAFDGQQVRKWASSIGSGNSNFTTADHPWEGEFSSALCIQNDELVIAGYSGNDHGTGAGDFPFRLPTPQPQPTGNTFYSEGLLTNASAIVYNLDGFITRFDVSGLTSRFTEKEFQLNPYILYPNPSQNSFSLLLPESVSSCNVSIFDISGRLLMAELKFIKGSTPIKTDHLSHGVYFVKITDSFSTQTLKLIKE